MSDLYAQLALTKGAPAGEIRKAYLRKAKLNHPDNGGDREEFQRAQHAYLVLRNPERRAEYDRTGIDPGEIVDNEQSQIITAISQLLAKYIIEAAGEQSKTAGQEKKWHSSLLPLMLSDLDAQTREVEKFKEQNEQNRKIIKKLMKKFSRKGLRSKRADSAKPDLIQLALQGQLAMIASAEAQIVAAAKLRAAVKLELQNYDFEIDPLMQQQAGEQMRWFRLGDTSTGNW